MKIFKFDDFINESVNISNKILSQIDEINKLIEQAKKDDVYAIEVNNITYENIYKFDKLELTKTKLKLYYSEGIPSTEKVDEINLKQDKENNYEDCKYMFSWIKKTIKKGYLKDKKYNIDENIISYKYFSDFKIEEINDNAYKWNLMINDKKYNGTIKLPKNKSGMVIIDWKCDEFPKKCNEIEEYITEEAYKIKNSK